MSDASEEAYFSSDTLPGLIHSGFTLLNARRVTQTSKDQGNFYTQLTDLIHKAIYLIVFAFPAVILHTYQKLYSRIAANTHPYPDGHWQFYLRMGLREDLAHYANETDGYHRHRPPEATELDDITAWVMTVIQFLWSYENLIGVVWDEWTMLRLVQHAADQTEELATDTDFVHLTKQWEHARPYGAPLNGTYADVRQAAFQTFIEKRLRALPIETQQATTQSFQQLAATQRLAFQKQMSLLAHVAPNKYLDTKEHIQLWDAHIGLIIGGQYYLLDVAAHDENGDPLLYGPKGTRQPLTLWDSTPFNSTGEPLILQGDCFYRTRDNTSVGYLDMASVSRTKGQLRSVLATTLERAQGNYPTPDILLAEAPRAVQARLRHLLPQASQQTLDELTQAPIIINWDKQPRDQSLAELRRTQRGVGDHALTILRTESSFIFDQSHIFFDGVWSLAMAEVLTNTAVRWCERCVTIAPSEASPPTPLSFEVSAPFMREAMHTRQTAEISAETTIHDITQIFKLRKLLSEKHFTHLTINDLLIITRIFHAAHYKPSSWVQSKIDEFQRAARSRAERKAAKAIDHALQRGRVTNPALSILVDASAIAPRQRIYPITFRNLADNLVWVWDQAWDAYQDYRRIEPPGTPQGETAFLAFAQKRAILIGNLRAFSYLLAANKAVAMRGDSLTWAVLDLVANLPTPVQWLLNTVIPEKFAILNEVIKGDEVYSNVGRVAEGASLTRFMTAKDDGNTKALCWGIMTDDNGRLIVTMRDFREFIKPLVQLGRTDLARTLSQDYVETYTASLIGLVARLWAMLQATPPQRIP